MIHRVKMGQLLHPFKDYFFQGFIPRQVFTRPKSYFSSIRKCSTDAKGKIKTDAILVEQLDNIRTIGINRPEKRNCINNATAKALLQAFKDFDEDEDSVVAILYGVGGNFCAGYDLEELSGASDLASALDPDMGPMGPTWYETSKPVIAAVQGYAVAGGLELALWCDIRIVEDTAVMGVFCRRFGVPLIDGGTVRLPAIVGLGRALDMILTGRPIRAPQALEFGLANFIVPCGTAVGRSITQAQSIAGHPQEALRADRASARRAVFASSVGEALQKEREGGLRALAEAQLGARSFMAGKGRHGKFNFKKEESPGDWESYVSALKEESASSFKKDS